jgi:bleomycin hydrolase
VPIEYNGSFYMVFRACFEIAVDRFISPLTRYHKVMAQTHEIPSLPSADGAVTPSMNEGYASGFDSQRAYRVSANAAVNNGVLAAAADYRGIRNLPRTFSLELKQGSITNQKRSGRCWMFAGLNVCRYEIIHSLGLEDFELSETYLFFWDKLEKANFYLESVLDTLDEPLDSRLFQTINEEPTSDGGWWWMFANLVRKYGLMPKEAFPESKNAENSSDMDQYVDAKCREDAAELRSRHQNGESLSALREVKNRQLNDIYRMLAISLGEPPKSFDFVVRIKDDSDDSDSEEVKKQKEARAKKGFVPGKVIQERGITPLEFAKKYLPLDVFDYADLMDAPQKEYGHVYSIKHEGNVVGGHDISFVNVGMDTIKKALIAQLQDGHPAWFACDCLIFSLRDKGIFDRASVNVEDLFDVRYTLNKADRLRYLESIGNHAMTIQGVDLDENGKPDRWKIENSWGKEPGQNGYFVMSDEWFSDFVYDVVIRKEYLDQATLKVVNSKPVEVEAWDPLCKATRSE